MKHTLLFSLLLFVVFGCDKADEPVIGPITLFKYTFSETDNTADSDDYVIIYNTGGASIDVKSGEAGETLTFQSDFPVGEKIMVSLFSVVKGARENYNIETYLDVPVGSEWRSFSDPAVGIMPPGTGLYRVDVTGLTNPLGISASDRQGINGFGMPTGSGTISIPNVSILSGEPKQFLFAYDETGPRYRWLENLADGSNLAFNHTTDLQSFDRTININLPGEQFLISTVHAFEGAPAMGAGYITHFLTAITPNNHQLKLGILNRFSSHYISIAYGGFGYTSSGPAPASIEYINPSAFTISNATISFFSYSATIAHEMRTTRFSYEEQGLAIGQTVYAPHGQHVQPPLLPAMFGTQFPKVQSNMSKMTHSYTRFDVVGQKYQDFIRSKNTMQENLLAPHVNSYVTIR